LEKSINVRPLRILFAGGGTGGHLFPAIAIAEKIKALEPDAEIAFVGTSDKIEARVVPQHGFGFRTIWISGFHRGFRLRNLLFPLKVVVAMIQARSILKEFRPDAVVGTGGYVAGPVLRSAVRLRIPALIQEQNSYPGVTTRILARQVNEVHVTFESSKRYLEGTKEILLSGNPTRDSLERAGRDEAFSHFGFDAADRSPVILVFGGSLGAHSINEAIAGGMAALRAMGVRLICQTGPADLERVRESMRSMPAGKGWIGAFIDRMDLAYAASDLVVARAGATTIAELTRLGKPAILVPYPHAAANHQVENARALAENGAARIVDDAGVGDALVGEIRSALEKNVLAEMSRRSKSLGRPDAAATIAKRVIALARGAGGAGDRRTKRANG
jgi:UDP-N-acetylglucosamine--N-acetylmuramyl-(pentapeptide) pyrophosphoryl-undecaprenol N-acetylglucosamine transferase